MRWQGRGAAADNAGSIRVLAKCGFTDYAHERGFAEARGQVIDELVSTHEVSFTTASWGNGLTSSYTSFSADADDIVFDHGIVWTQSMSNAGSQLARAQAWAKSRTASGVGRISIPPG